MIDTLRPFCLWRFDDDFAVDIRGRATHANCPGVEVEVAPMQCLQLRAPQAGVGEADVLVKDAFFSLNGKALSYLLDKYEELYGKTKREYAQRTIPKWRSDERQMSGDVAKRLFDLMPPLMPTNLKHQVVEKIWKRYGPHSKKYVYVGPDADRVAVMHDVQNTSRPSMCSTRSRHLLSGVSTRSPTTT